MNKEKIIRKVCFMWTFLFLGLLSVQGAKKSVNTFNSPDFAFPKKVAANARPELAKALNNGKGDDALKALIQIVISENLISADNAGEGAVLIDSVAGKLSSPYSSLAYMLEARLYRDIYSVKPYIYNNRAIPTQPVPSDINEWSKDIFSNKVCQLTNKAFDVLNSGKDTPLSTFGTLLTNVSDAEKAGLTLIDFMTIQGVENLRPFSNNGRVEIPFFTVDSKGGGKREMDASSIIEKILSDNYLWHQSKGESRAAAVMDLYCLDNSSKDVKAEDFEGLIKKYSGTPWCVPFIVRLADFYSPSDNEKYKEVYSIGEKYLNANPECVDSEALKGLLHNLAQVSIRIELPDQSLPGKKISGDVTYRNIEDFYIHAVKVDDSYLDKNINLNMLENKKVAKSVHISKSQDMTKPFYETSPFEFISLESGVYAIVTSRTNDLSGLIRNAYRDSRIPVMLVSRLSVLTSSDNRKREGENQLLYVVDGNNQAPIEGAKVTFSPAWNNAKWKTVSFVSDKDGKVKAPAGSYNVMIKKGSDIYQYSVYDRGEYREPNEITDGSVLTDLSIYHPDDSVGFAAIVYTRFKQEFKSAAEKDIRAFLVDANYQLRDTINLRTDKFGRVNGKFRIPEDGLLGSWSVRVQDKKNIIAQSFFEVSEYKSPTFYVLTEGTEGEIELGEPVRIRGEVKSYSGMPLGGATIKYDVNFIPWYRYGRNAGMNANYGGVVTSSPDGSFLIELPTSSLRDTPYQYGRYQLNVSATNEAGETQQGRPVGFSLGKAYSIRCNIPDMICVDKGEKADASVTVYDMLDHPVVKKIFYIVKSTSDSAVVASGSFDSGKFPVEFSSLKSGEYKASFSLTEEGVLENRNDDKGGFGKERAETSFVVWRISDKTPAVKTALWLPEDKITVSADNLRNGKVPVRVGSSYNDSYIYSELSDLNGVYSRKWLKISDGIVEVDIKAPGNSERVKATFRGMHDLDGVQKSVVLIPEIQTKNLEVNVESFRNLLTPGAKESWKFSFAFDDKVVPSVPAIAVMSNKALDAISPFQWVFNPYGSLYWNLPGVVSSQGIRKYSWNYSPEKEMNSRITSFETPQWNTYGYYSLVNGGIMTGRGGALKIRGTSMMKSAATVKTEEAFDSSDGVMIESVPVMNYAAAAPDNGALKESIEEEKLSENPVVTGGVHDESEQIRDVECPLAFFMPDLITDESGKVTLDFTVPSFNGTWKLQLMGYTSDMRGTVLTKEAVASKPVMVQMNAPRFARTGDKLSVSATIYNNTSDAAQLSGRIELFNPLTDQIYINREMEKIEIPAMGSEVMSAEWRVPGDIDVLGIRVYGMNRNARDGEQTIVPIYPSSTPVVESKTFYLSPGEENYSVSIPTDRENEVLTLAYTDNPIWECVTALPALMSTDSKNALTLAQALYGTATSAGLLKRYPQIREALSIFSDPKNTGDSALVSNLEKNAALKIVTLNNTPWVMNAQSETVRMISLADYLDASKSKKAIQESLIQLKKLQNGDGGWSWCDGMKSSEWITTSVLRNLAMLRKSGFLPNEAESMAIKGVGYMDSEIVKNWRKTGAKKYSYLSLLDYLYVRSFFDKLKVTSDFETIRNRALIEIGKNWKKMSINDKATAAVLLHRSGNDNIAKIILLSLEEYSSKSKEKGVWFDNLHSGLNGRGKLLTTAQVLEAYTEIDPKSTIVDGLRQWLLLSKQVQDWGGGSAAADIIQAILDCGSDWTGSAPAPEIYVGTERIEPDKLSLLTSSLNVSLTGKKGEVRIKRSSTGPAWGGIISQYVAPINEVKSQKIPELSIEKNVYVITNGEDGTTASSENLKKGDRVRITLTIKNDRDLQYVAVTDSRSAALEPAEQVSGYTSTDGVWYYKEIRNSSTNLFIPFLSKGTHVITYDCFVDRDGAYTLGIAEAQSQYAPVITAHSAGEVIVVTSER